MDDERKIRADELIRALGALGEAQEVAPGSTGVAVLAKQVDHLRSALEMILLPVGQR